MYLGRIAIAANRVKAFPRFEDVQNTILPCGEKEAVALFSSPPWIHRVTSCTTNEEVVDVFRLYHEQCWSEESEGVTDPIIWTTRWKARYKKIRKRLKFLDRFVAEHNSFPATFEKELEFSSEDEPVKITEPTLPKHRPVIPGDFVLTFNVIVLANSLESQFPHRSEYWWTLLPGNLDQACMCLSMQQWVDQLKTCEDEESFLTVYQSFLDTAWQAFEEVLPLTNTFPYVLPTETEVRRAYYMKNRTLHVHNQLVWGPGADDDRPVVSTTQEESKQKSSSGGTLTLLAGGSEGGEIPSGGNDGDDPDKRKSDETPSKGDESQDPEKKEEEQEATTQEPEKTSAEKAAQERVDNLERQLREAREDAERVRKEENDKARKSGEELAQQIDDEKAKKERKREASKEKKKRKKQKKTGEAESTPQPDGEGESETSDDDDKPEGESKKPEGEESKDKKTEEGEIPKEKPEGEEKSEEKTKTDGEEKPQKSEEGPPKDEEPTESWTEVLKRVVKPRPNLSKAADKARARTYPRARCAETAQPNYTYRSQHVPTRDPVITGKWSVVEKTKDIPPARNPIRLKDAHKAINEHGTRKRYTDYKICVLQVMEARRQIPPPASPFALDGGDAYWVQTTMQLHEDGSLPFSELPGMFPSLYTFDTFWEIPRRQEGQQLKGIT